MRGMLAIGLILLVLGGILLTVGYVSYRDTDPVVDIGPLEVTKTETKRRNIPTLVSGTIFAVGVVLTIAGARKKA